MKFRAASGALVLLLGAGSWAQGSQGARRAASILEEERCIGPAAHHHRVNPLLLRAILKAESNLNPHAIGRNGDGTIDIGIGQVNSRHLPLLAANGIQPAHLLDPCIGTYVAAWHLSRVIAVHGNTWEGVARYHSGTPYFNRRYQILLNNELVAAGVIGGQRRAVPPLRQYTKAVKHSAGVIRHGTESAMALDE
jgi:soluble lytic murein transglycosylase-like protein